MVDTGEMLRACKDRNKKCGQRSRTRLYVDPGVPYEDGNTLTSIAVGNALADVTVFLDAASPGFAYADGARMTTGWNSRDPNTRNFNNDYGVGTYGLYKTNSGKPYVDFDSSNTKIGRNLVVFTDFMGLNVGTVYFVMAQYGTVNATAVHRPGDSTNKWLFHLAYSDDNMYFDWGNQFGGGRVSNAMPVGWKDGTFRILEIRRAGNGLRVRYGKTATPTTLLTNVAAYSSARTNTTDNLDLGGVTGSQWKLSQFLTWKRALSDAECDSIYAYLLAGMPA